MTRFQLPPKGSLQPNTPHDPLPYYYRSLVGRIYRARIDLCLELLTPPYKRALEIGYGSGVLLPTLAGICDELHGIDPDSDPDAAREAIAPLGVHAHLYRDLAENMVFPANHFDLVVAISVMEHIASAASILTAIARVLKPGGHLLIGMPRVDAFMGTLFRAIGFSSIEDFHCTSHKMLLEESTRVERFELKTAVSLPTWLPSWAGLYYGLLLVRRDGG